MLDALLSLDPERLALPLTRIKPTSWFDTILGYPPVKALLPIPILVALAPAVWWFFRNTWRELDQEATEHRKLLEGNKPDLRPAVCLMIVAVVLTLQEYYGGREIYNQVIRPALVDWEAAGWKG